MTLDEKKDHNVVDLASARKKQRTVQPKAKVHGASAKGGNGKAPAPQTSRFSKKAVGVVQLALFLGVLFYFTQLCGRG